MENDCGSYRELDGLVSSSMLLHRTLLFDNTVDTSDRIFPCSTGSCEHFFNSSPGQQQAFKDCLPSVNANPCVSYRFGKVPGRMVKLSLFKCLNEVHR